VVYNYFKFFIVSYNFCGWEVFEVMARSFWLGVCIARTVRCWLEREWWWWCGLAGGREWYPSLSSLSRLTADPRLSLRPSVCLPLSLAPSECLDCLLVTKSSGASISECKQEPYCLSWPRHQSRTLLLQYTLHSHACEGTHIQPWWTLSTEGTHHQWEGATTATPHLLFTAQAFCWSQGCLTLPQGLNPLLPLLFLQISKHKPNSQLINLLPS
jgi:hypothetical protein